MRARSFADARRVLLEIPQEFGRLQKRIDAVRDCVTSSLTHIFGEERPAMAALAEEELIERIAGSVVARLGTAPKSQAKGDQRHVRDVEAAAFLGVSVFTLRSWRNRGTPLGPPVTRIGKMVMYSVRELERFMEERTSRRQ